MTVTAFPLFDHPLPPNQVLPPDPALLPTSVIEAELIASVTAQNASIHQQLRLLLAYDQRGAWVPSGAISCARWWAEVANIEVSTARDQMRVARSIDELPQLDAALADGSLSYAKIRYIARYADADNVADLILIARSVPAGRLGAALAGYNASLLSSDKLDARQHANRSVSWKVDADGMVVVTARLTPKDGAVLTTRIQSMVMQGVGQARDLIGQQRCDAFKAALSAGTPANAVVNPSTEVLIYVTTSPDGAVVHALADGTPLPRPQASELMCGAAIRALVHDSKGRPIDVSPSAPGPSKRQLLLIRARDKHCQYGTCRARSFLHAHHIEHREHGGPTTISNLTLLCSLHHRFVHATDTGWKPAWKCG